MKRITIASALLGAALMMAGCASSFPVGAILTEVKLPVAVTSNSGKSTKVGVATCESYFGLLARGDASIETAKKNGGITKVHHIDWEAENILGVIGKYKLTVYGE